MALLLFAVVTIVVIGEAFEVAEEVSEVIGVLLEVTEWIMVKMVDLTVKGQDLGTDQSVGVEVVAEVSVLQEDSVKEEVAVLKETV